MSVLGVKAANGFMVFGEQCCATLGGGTWVGGLLGLLGNVIQTLSPEFRKECNGTSDSQQLQLAGCVPPGDLILCLSLCFWASA